MVCSARLKLNVAIEICKFMFALFQTKTLPLINVLTVYGLLLYQWTDIVIQGVKNYHLDMRIFMVILEVKLPLLYFL